MRRHHAVTTLLTIAALVVALGPMWCVAPLRGAVAQQQSEVDSLRAEIASLKKKQKRERVVCSALAGFNIFHFVR